MKLEGVYLPVTTPFDPARGGIDLEAFGRNLRSWSEHPVAGYVIAGSTGEAPLLDEPEIEALVAKARDVVGESAAVLAGTGLESTRATIRLGQIAAQAGAEALLVRPPSYYKGQMTPEALRVHFLEVADSAPVPVVLYHVPKFVPVGLEPELVAERRAMRTSSASRTRRATSTGSGRCVRRAQTGRRCSSGPARICIPVSRSVRRAGSSPSGCSPRAPRPGYSTHGRPDVAPRPAGCRSASDRCTSA